MIVWLGHYSMMIGIAISVLIYWIRRGWKAYRTGIVVDHKDPVKSHAEQAYLRAADEFAITGDDKDLERALAFVDENGGFKYPDKDPLADKYGDWTWHDEPKSIAYRSWDSPNVAIMGEYGPEDIRGISMAEYADIRVKLVTGQYPYGGR